MGDIKQMVLVGQIWKDVHNDYVHVDEVFISPNKITDLINLTRIHDDKKLRLKKENFFRHFKLHNGVDKKTLVGTVLTDVYNDFFIIETYLSDECCYLLRNLKSSLVELFTLDEVDKYFDVYKYDMEG